jgi:hypothetical protein
MTLASESKRHERTKAGLINRALSLKRCRAKTDATPVSGARSMRLLNAPVDLSRGMPAQYQSPCRPPVPDGPSRTGALWNVRRLPGSPSLIHSQQEI